MQAGRDELAARRKIQVNNAAARFIPVFLIGVVGYVTWVVAVLISVHFFLDPSQCPARNGAGIAILVLYFLLLAFLALNYFRLFHVLFTNNGFVPQRGQEPSTKSEANLETQTYHRSCAPTTIARQPEDRDHEKTFLDHASILDGTTTPPPGTEEFYSRDIFVCDAQENDEKNTGSTPSQSKTFAIIQTSPGDNPWDLGLYENLKNVMGDRWWDWLLPLKYSPLCDHKSGTSEFPFGPVVDSLKKENGLSLAGSKVRTRRRRRA
ncbi:MAG: hypothetical protein Q9165_007189 [Trypethelium subeluteriae]